MRALVRGDAFLGHYDLELVQEIKELAAPFGRDPYPDLPYYLDFADSKETFYITKHDALGHASTDSTEFSTQVHLFDIDDTLSDTSSSNPDASRGLAPQSASPQSASSSAVAEKEKSSTDARVLQGIQNGTRSQCFANALVQLLSGLPGLSSCSDTFNANGVFDVKFSKKGLRERGRMVARLCDAAHVNPAVQQDPSELLHKLYANLSPARAGLLPSVTEAVSIACLSPQCDARSLRTVDHVSLQLRVTSPTATSVQALLDALSDPEDVDWKCGESADHIYGTSTVEWSTSSEHLILVINRYREFTRDDRVQSYWPTRVNVDRIVKLNGKLYERQAAIAHQGSAKVDSGHYVAYVGDKLTDDKRVLPAPKWWINYSSDAAQRIVMCRYRAVSPDVDFGSTTSQLASDDENQLDLDENGSYLASDNDNESRVVPDGEIESQLTSDNDNESHLASEDEPRSERDTEARSEMARSSPPTEGSQTRVTAKRRVSLNVGAILSSKRVSPVSASARRLAALQGAAAPVTLRTLSADEATKFYLLATRLRVGSSVDYATLVKTWNKEQSGLCLTVPTAKQLYERCLQRTNRQWTLQPRASDIQQLRRSFLSSDEVARGLAMEVPRQNDIASMDLGDSHANDVVSLAGYQAEGRAVRARRDRHCKTCHWRLDAIWHRSRPSRCYLPLTKRRAVHLEAASRSAQVTMERWFEENVTLDPATEPKRLRRRGRRSYKDGTPSCT